MTVFADNLLASAAALSNEKAVAAEEDVGFDLVLEDVSDVPEETVSADSKAEKAQTNETVSPENEVSEISDMNSTSEIAETAKNTQDEKFAEKPKTDEIPENSKNSQNGETEDSEETLTISPDAETAEIAAETEEGTVSTQKKSTETVPASDSVKTHQTRQTSQSHQTSQPTNSPSSSATLPPATEMNLREDAIVRAIRAARPAVVNIRGEKVMKPVPYDATTANPASGPASNPADPPADSPESQHVNGMGTGILFDPRGYVVTNFHVVDGIEEIHVTTADSKTYVAQVLARDRETDLAIIKIDALAGEVFETIHLGESSDLMTGETVIAVGNAFGYEHTVTKGIISALHRSVQVSDVQFYQDLIQTDASINPGNSGGPLLNINGEMIGINVAVRAGAQGIGFAIPINRAMEVVTKMVESFSNEKNWHGIQFVSLPIGSAGGAVVQSVEPNSPAESIGLKPGDVILAVNQQKISHELNFACAIMELKAGETIRLSVSRNQKMASVKLAMGVVSKNRSASAYAPEMVRKTAFNAEKLTDEEVIWKEIGVLATPVTGSTIPLQGNRKYRGGLLVQNVRPNSPAARQGIRNGDVLLGILRWETLSLENVLFVLSQPELQTPDPIKFLLVRNGKVHLGHFAANDFPQPTMETASAAYQTRK